MAAERGLDRELIRLRGLRDEMSSVLDRVESIVSVRQTGAPNYERIGNFLIDRSGHRVLVDDVEVAVTAKEFRLLSYLLAHSGRMLTYEELQDRVWEAAVGKKTIHVHVRWLREKLSGRVPLEIVNVRGIGYRLDRLSAPAPASSAGP